MKLSLGLAVLGVSALLALFEACATNDDDTSTAPDSGTPIDSASPTMDAAVSPDGDAALPCADESDCKIFPNACSDQTLCGVDIAVDPSSRLLSLWASGDHDLWAAGTIGTVVHSTDGATWTIVPTGRQETLRAVTGLSATDVWFASTDRFLMHNRGLAADGGVAWDVYDTSSEDTPHIMQSIWGSSAQGVYGLVDNMYGSTGLIFHSKGWTTDGGGPAWAFDLAPTSPGPFGGRSLIGFGASDVWSGWVGGQLFRRDVDGGWNELNSTTQSTLNGLWGTSGNDLFLVGSHGTIRHWDGQAMTTIAIDPDLQDVDLFGVCGTSTNDVWMVGDAGLVLHWDGQKLTRISIGALGGRRPALRGVWVSATSTQVAIVGDAIVLTGKKGALP